MKTSLTSALAVSILLLLAAIAKWLYPTNLPLHLDRIALGLEICVALLLPLIHRKAWAWAGISALFSLWLGYSVFWFIQNENCGCFGYALDISAGITTAINAIAIGLAFWNWGILDKTPKRKAFFVVIDGMLLIIGFLTAVWINWTIAGSAVGHSETVGLRQGRAFHAEQ